MVNLDATRALRRLITGTLACTLLFKQKDNLPAHIKHMFDSAHDDDRGKRAANNELIDNLFVKRNGKWEMNLSAPIFEQGKVRCYIYRRWNLNP